MTCISFIKIGREIALPQYEASRRAKGSGSVRLSKVCAFSMANNQNDQITGADINGETMVYRGYHYVSKFDMNALRRGQCNEQGPY